MTNQHKIVSCCRITDNQLIINQKVVLENPNLPSTDWLSYIYKNAKMIYPKFFKMDRLSKAGILAAEMLMNDIHCNNDQLKNNWAIACINHSSSLDDDISYQKTIEADNFYPSPSVFVYTLANIVTGEIAIKHKILGETSFYIAERFDANFLIKTAQDIFQECANIDHILCGWCEYLENHCDIMMTIITREEKKTHLELNEENINNYYKISWNN